MAAPSPTVRGGERDTHPLCGPPSVVDVEHSPSVGQSLFPSRWELNLSLKAKHTYSVVHEGSYM